MSIRARSPLLACLLLLLPLGAQSTLRVASYNVQSLGPVGSPSWNAARSTLTRLSADFVALQEVADGESAQLPLLAGQAGYAHSFSAANSGTLSGGIRVGFLSRLPVLGTTVHTAATLSQDPGANDIGRSILEARVELPNGGGLLGVFVVHLKAGTSSEDDFRRMVEIVRLGQALDAFVAAHPGAPWVVAGDWNEDQGDGPFTNTFTQIPGSVPPSYSLGSDISLPLPYRPFQAITGRGGVVLFATQEDTTSVDATRPASGRRLDYVMHRGLTIVGDEIYNSVRDNGVDDPPVGNWLPKAGTPLGSGTSLQASDHLPVFADAQLSAPPPSFPPLLSGDVVISEYMVAPAAAPGILGQWVELRNTTGQEVDLTGAVLRVPQAASFSLPALTVPARGRALLAASASPALNGGVTPDLVWPSGSFTLPTSSPSLELLAPDSTLLDGIYAGPGLPSPVGASVERRDATALPWASNFAVATTPFGAGDLGTPGSANAAAGPESFTTLLGGGLAAPGGSYFLNLDGGFGQAGLPYQLALATCPAPGIVLGSGRVLDLCPDPLFLLSLDPPAGVFNAFSGQLNFFGLAVASFAIPNAPFLSGQTLFVGGVTVDGSAPDGIRSIIDGLRVTIL